MKYRIERRKTLKCVYENRGFLVLFYFIYFNQDGLIVQDQTLRSALEVKLDEI